MVQTPECLGIIPARYHSSRFPGKPLAEILGKPMFWHVYQRARRCPALSRVILATDDDRIASAARSLHVPVILTRSDHPSGTDRVLEAAELLQAPAASVIVNIQGDEPALEAGMIEELLAPFKDPSVEVTTLAREMTPDEARNPDRVKVVLGRGRRALYFSRAPIPFMRSAQATGHYGHVGMYAFRLETLRRFVALEQSPLEKIENLEQLRLLENDIPVYVAATAHRSIGVDRPEDLALAAAIIRENPV